MPSVKQQQAIRRAAAETGKRIETEGIDHVRTQVAEFKTKLTEFAAKHRLEINKDPDFRIKFAQMTKTLDVDPLVSSRGFWAEALGLSTFYKDLAVQIVDVCYSLRDRTGGLVSLAELTERISKMRGSGSSASSKYSRIKREDVLTAIEKLAVLGGGYKVIKMGTEDYVMSVPYELDSDQTILLHYCATTFGQMPASGAGTMATPMTSAASLGWATVKGLAAALKWDEKRVERVLLRLLQEGMAWVDGGHELFASEGYRYYFPAITGFLTATVT